MEIIETRDLEKQLKQIPTTTQRKYTTQKKRLGNDVRDQRLHTKKMTDMSGVYSFRINRAYRALFFFYSSDIVVIFAIGHRKDIYRNK